jgi:hypothetical protein
VFSATSYSFKRRGPKMDIQEYPRIGNRSDAIVLLDRIIEEVDDKACYSNFIGIALETLRDAIEREIL